MTTKLILCMGPGGVGKSTCSAALALSLAKKGKKVGLITVDPAHRLAQVLGLKKLKNEASEVYKSEQGGSLHALWLNTDKALEGLIKIYSSDADLCKKITEHKFFRLIESQLGGMENYLAINQLIRMKEEGAYDLILVDTPPSQQALDFLNSPQKILAFFDDETLKYFTHSQNLNEEGLIKSFLSKAKNYAIDGFKLLLGQGFFSELGTLLEMAGPLKQGLFESAASFKEWSQNKETHYYILAIPEQASTSIAHKIFKDIENYFPDAQISWIFNKCLNEELNKYQDEIIHHSDSSHWEHLSSALNTQKECLIKTKEQTGLQSLHCVNHCPPAQLNYDKLLEIGDTVLSKNDL